MSTFMHEMELAVLGAVDRLEAVCGIHADRLASCLRHVRQYTIPHSTAMCDCPFCLEIRCAVPECVGLRRMRTVR
jgi:hypothetical protein